MTADRMSTRRGKPAVEQTFTRRQFLTYQMVMEGANVWLAIEAVSSTAIEHPEWDMDEEMTWAQWQAKK